MDLSKKGFLLCSNFFSIDEILKMEKLFIQLVLDPIDYGRSVTN